jgi:hypothetical protein
MGSRVILTSFILSELDCGVVVDASAESLD